MPYVRVFVDDGDVIDELNTEDLKEELKRRGEVSQAEGHTLPMLDGQDSFTGRFHDQLIGDVYEARRNGDDARALELVDRLIYAAIGRIV